MASDECRLLAAHLRHTDPATLSAAHGQPLRAGWPGPLRGSVGTCRRWRLAGAPSNECRRPPAHIRPDGGPGLRLVAVSGCAVSGPAWVAHHAMSSGGYQFTL